MPNWKPWSDEDEELEKPAVEEVVTVQPALDDAELDELLTAKLADVLDPPGLEQAHAYFRKVSPGASILGALGRTRAFCKRFSRKAP